MDKKTGLLLMASLPVFVNATVSYDDGLTYTRNYIDKFPDYNKYINMVASGEFQKGQFIGKDEFDITNTNNNSWLLDPLQYWTLTNAGSGKKYVIDNALRSLPTSSTSGVRITEYVRKETAVKGTGTISNPWEFVEQYEVVFFSENPKLGTISNEIQILSKGDSNLQFKYVTAPGYRFDRVACTNVRVNNSEEDKNFNNMNITKGTLTINNDDIDKDTRCAVYFAPRNDINYVVKTRMEKANESGYDEIIDRKIGTTDTSVTETIPSYEGFNLVSSASTPTTFNIKGDGTSEVVFTFNRNKYNVSLSGGTGISSVTGGGLYKYEQNVTIDANVSTGFTWSKWSNGNTEKTTTIKVPKDGISLTAEASRIQTTVTLNGNGSTSSGSLSVKASYGLAMPSINIPEKKYKIDFDSGMSGVSNPTSLYSTYTFGGYFTDSNGTGTKYYESNGSSAKNWDKTVNTTLYAKWTDSNAGVNLPSLSKSGYKFDGWSENPAGGTKVSFNGYKATKNIKLTGLWSVVTPDSPSSPSSPSSPDSSSGSGGSKSVYYKFVDSDGKTTYAYVAPDKLELTLRQMANKGVDVTATCVTGGCGTKGGSVTAENSLSKTITIYNNDGSMTITTKSNTTGNITGQVTYTEQERKQMCALDGGSWC